jgi:hypothetical protein
MLQHSLVKEFVKKVVEKALVITVGEFSHIFVASSDTNSHNKHLSHKYVISISLNEVLAIEHVT